jgi:hypothetical protein
MILIITFDQNSHNHFNTYHLLLSVAMAIYAQTFVRRYVQFRVKICTFNHANRHRGASLNSEAIDDISVSI